MDRISGFGPEDGGSIPPGFVFPYSRPDFVINNFRIVKVKSLAHSRKSSANVKTASIDY